MQNSNSDKFTVETIIKTYEHHPSIKLIIKLLTFKKKTMTLISKLLVFGQINKITKGLNPKKAKEPDKISVNIVKLAAIVIDSNLSNIINNDLSNNAFSDSAKLASVRPIYKKDHRNEIKNHRPVSILNCFSKIYEKVLNEQFLPFVNRSLSELMTSYRSGYSMNRVLIRLIEN